MDEQTRLDMVCRLAGFVTEQVYPLEFRLAAIGILVVSVIVVVEAILERVG